VNIESAMRLARLVSEHRKAVRRLHRLQRRIVRLLLDAPEDAALRESVLAHLEQELAAAYALASARLFGASKGQDVDALIAQREAEQREAHEEGHAA
jgi:hypothetical protein